MEEDKLEKYWDYAALEARDFEKWRRIEKWRKVARNWLADYADKRAYDFVLEVLNEVVGLYKSAKILDVGCGPGKWSIFLDKFGSITAIDVSPEMVLLAKENARKHGLRNVAFYVMDVSKLNFPDAVYDFVNCVTVLQHIHDDERWRMAIREIVRVTRTGGYMLLFETAPNVAVIKRTRYLKIRTMRQYVDEFKSAGASLVYWRAVDLSLPITLLGLRAYAASFNKRVYYFISKNRWVPAGLLSFLSWAAALLAGLIDYRLAETPLSFLSFGRILLFRKN
ncbi:MAG: class I SAM-dependent methyltransferase [Candidatus Bathyarchaeales archaeon]